MLGILRFVCVTFLSVDMCTRVHVWDLHRQTVPVIWGLSAPMHILMMPAKTGFKQTLGFLGSQVECIRVDAVSKISLV